METKIPLDKNISKYLQKIKGVMPQPKVKPSVGLDIGTSGIKIVSINNLAQSHQINKFAIEPVNNHDIKSSIARAIEKSGITAKLVNTSVSGQGVIIRYIAMPKMSISDIKSSINLEADKYFPFPLEDVIMDCTILEERESENKVFALVAAAKKELIDQRISLLTSLGLEPEMIYTDSIAMANIFSVLGDRINPLAVSRTDGKPSAIAILNIGGADSILNIMKGSIPCFTRDIFIGGVDFTKRISNVFGLDFKSAEELKLNPADEQERIIQSCESVLNNLVSEIRISFDYFETENNIPVGILYVSGGGSGLKGLVETLASNLTIDVRIWQPFLELDLSPDLSREDLACNANKLNIAIGLALR